MESFELVLILAIYAMGLALIGRKIGVIDPIMLVLGGLALSLIDAMPSLTIDPHFVLTIFLPPVLYQAAISLSWRDMKANLRPILLLAVGLVLFTAFSIAGLLWLMVPSIPFAAALVLGAIVSPPDAVSANAVLSKIRVPRRLVTILEGESLINDATALVLYGLAVETVMRNHFVPSEVVGEFLWVAVGGLGLGLVVGWLSTLIHHRLKDPMLELMLSLILPFLTFILGEHWHVSGVLAVVAAGILRGAFGAKHFHASTRLQVLGMWNIIVFVLNAIGFLIIGAQIKAILTQLGDKYNWLQLCELAFVVCAAVIATRFIWIWIIALIERTWLKIRKKPTPPSSRGYLTIKAWSGMRGIVSLVAALALPSVTDAYVPFPARDIILFLTYAVILVTLVGQGSTLAWVVRKLKIEAASAPAQHGRNIRAQLRLAGLAALRENEDEALSPTAQERAIEHYTQMINRLKAADSEDGFEDLIEEDSADYRYLSTLALKAEREALHTMRRQNRIDDELAQELQRELDLHEILIGTERSVG